MAALFNHATMLPSAITYSTVHPDKGSALEYKDTLSYRYNEMGYIREVLENGLSVCRYEYDTLGRLTREDNRAFGKTKIYTYDEHGNITARYEYPFTDAATGELSHMEGVCVKYGYQTTGDKLFSYQDEGFGYDFTGVPVTYRSQLFTWKYGRYLTGSGAVTYDYDSFGRRIRKGNITFAYSKDGQLLAQSDGLSFLYDHTGLFAFLHNEATYYYRKNAQNDVIAILDNTGTLVVQYKYDAWGNQLVLDASGVEITDTTHIGHKNPFRYRSYYFDTETGLYFLTTRYYNDCRKRKSETLFLRRSIGDAKELLRDIIATENARFCIKSVAELTSSASKPSPRDDFALRL